MQLFRQKKQQEHKNKRKRFRAAAETSNIQDGCCKKLTADEMFEILWSTDKREKGRIIDEKEKTNAGGYVGRTCGI